LKKNHIQKRSGSQSTLFSLGSGSQDTLFSYFLLEVGVRIPCFPSEVGVRVSYFLRKRESEYSVFLGSGSQSTLLEGSEREVGIRAPYFPSGSGSQDPLFEAPKTYVQGYQQLNWDRNVNLAHSVGHPSFLYWKPKRPSLRYTRHWRAIVTILKGGNVSMRGSQPLFRKNSLQFPPTFKDEERIL